MLWSSHCSDQQQQPGAVWNLECSLEDAGQSLQPDLVLQHILLLPPDAVSHCLPEQSDQDFLLRRVQARQHRNVVLPLGAIQGSCANFVDEVSADKCKSAKSFSRHVTLDLLEKLLQGESGESTYVVTSLCRPLGSRNPFWRARSAYCWPVRAYLEASSGEMYAGRFYYAISKLIFNSEQFINYKLTECWNATFKLPLLEHQTSESDDRGAGKAHPAPRAA